MTMSQIEEELQSLKIENARLQKENQEKDIYRQKYVDVIGKLNNLSNSDTAHDGEEHLLNNADKVVDDVVSSYATLPDEEKKEVTKLGAEGTTFLKRLETVEQMAAHNQSNARYALNEVEEVKQYLKKDQLLVHGLKDFPRNHKGYIKNGRPFSEYMAGKFKDLLPDLKESKEEILRCISISHVITSYNNPSNIIALVKFSICDMRNTIFFSKRSLKGSGIAITEHLTPATQEILTTAKKLFGKHNSWTNQCKVKVFLGGKRYSMKSVDDCYNLQDWYHKNRRNNASNNNVPPGTPELAD